MREIKFRAWDNANNEWLNKEDTECLIIYLDGRYEIDRGCCIVPPDLTIEQYTGLKDKNGREIYEGDIISFHDYGSFAIKFHKGCFRLGSGDLLYAYPSSAIEVIGNIHENPELLGGEE